MFSDQFNDHRWIKVKQFRDDSTLSWPERFAALERHHLEETAFLIEKVRELARHIDKLEASHE
jgi:hypothetical protein